VRDSGIFITFEGTTGSGKTTQLRLLAAYLRGEGYDVLTTREPGGTPIGDRIRDIVLDPQYTDMEPLAEVLLFSASRAQLISQVIRPHLERGGVVLCDRYADSTFAYQGYGHGMDLTLLRQITVWATGGLTPDLTFYLDLPVEKGLERRRPMRGEGIPEVRTGQGNDGQPSSWEACDRLDLQMLEFHRRVRQGYLELAAGDPQRGIVVDASRPVDEVQREIRRHIRTWLARREGR